MGGGVRVIILVRDTLCITLIHIAIHFHKDFLAQSFNLFFNVQFFNNFPQEGQQNLATAHTAGRASCLSIIFPVLTEESVNGHTSIITTNLQS